MEAEVSKSARNRESKDKCRDADDLHRQRKRRCGHAMAASSIEGNNTADVTQSGMK